MSSAPVGSRPRHVPEQSRPYGEFVRAVVQLVEDVVLGLCGLVAGWIVVSNMPGTVLPVIAATVAMAIGGRMLFDGTIWTTGAGLVIAGAVGVGLYTADVLSSFGT